MSAGRAIDIDTITVSPGPGGRMAWYWTMRVKWPEDTVWGRVIVPSTCGPSYQGDKEFMHALAVSAARILEEEEEFAGTDVPDDGFLFGEAPE